MSQEKTEKQLVSPYLTINNADQALEWYTKALNGKVIKKMNGGPNGSKVLHSELQLPNGAIIYASDDFPEHNNGQSSAPSKEVGTSVVIHLHFQHGEGDKFWKHLIENYKQDISNVMAFDFQFWMDKYGKFTDPFGHSWSISQTMTKEEIEQYEEKQKTSGKKRSYMEAELDDPQCKKIKLSNGFVNVEDHPSKHGLFIDYLVGSKGNYTYESAAHDGYPKLNKIAQDNQLMNQNPQWIALCPDDPKMQDPIRFSMGLLFDESVDLSKCETDEIKIKKIPPLKYFIYQHVGSYDTSVSWKESFDEMHKQGYVTDQCDYCYENYMNACNSDEHAKQIRLCIPVKHK